MRHILPLHLNCMNTQSKHTQTGLLCALVQADMQNVYHNTVMWGATSTRGCDMCSACTMVSVCMCAPDVCVILGMCACVCVCVGLRVIVWVVSRGCAREAVGCCFEAGWERERERLKEKHPSSNIQTQVPRASRLTQSGPLHTHTHTHAMSPLYFQTQHTHTHFSLLDAGGWAETAMRIKEQEAWGSAMTGVNDEWEMLFVWVLHPWRCWCHGVTWPCGVLSWMSGGHRSGPQWNKTHDYNNKQKKKILV